MSPKATGLFKVNSIQLSLVTLLVLFNLTKPAFAAENATNADTNAISTTAPKNLSKSIQLGYKSWNDSGRLGDLDKTNARNFKSKNEFFLGYKMDSGWGAYGQIVQYYNSYNDNAAATKWSQGDSSLTLVHPDLYKSADLSIFGQFRYYIPTTDRSIKKDIKQYAYYLRESYNLNPTVELFNESVLRYFDAKIYSAADTNFYLEDTTVLNYAYSSSWKLGLKSWIQIEQHDSTATGTYWELGPQAVYSFNKNLSLSPSLSFPIYKNNAVFDSASSVTADQAYLDLFLQVKL